MSTHCPTCGILKTFNNTYRDKSRKDGIASWCKKCSQTKSKTIYKDQRKQYYYSHRTLKGIPKGSNHYCFGVFGQDHPGWKPDSPKNIIRWWVAFLALTQNALIFRIKFFKKAEKLEYLNYLQHQTPKNGQLKYYNVYNKLHPSNYIRDPQKQRTNKKKYKKIHPERVKIQRLARNARKRGAFVQLVHPKEIYMRDGWKCQICGGKVGKKLKVPHPMAPTIDHIIPLAKGGTHEPKNVQLAHFICNSYKSDKAANDQLRIF